MQRKGVPAIDGCLCEIKEKLKALYDRTHACILRINGKTPDGNGDITLDLSDAIPGRYVESVNGQDGNVIIDKASVGLSNVDNVSSSQILNQADANNQSRLEAFEAAKLDPVELEVTANSGRIIQLEGQQVVLDDKMEQTIQYVDAIGDDVAEIKDAYVDKTSTQYITGKKYGPTPTSADYSGMWVNKDFVETTDPTRRQNNLVHTISDEHIDGVKEFVTITTENASSLKSFFKSKYYSVSSASRASTPWKLLYKLTSFVSTTTNSLLTLVYTGARGAGGYYPAIITVYESGNTVLAYAIGSSASTCIKIISTPTAVYIFGYAANRNSGSGSSSFNVISGRNEDRWEKIVEDQYYAISDGTVTYPDGRVYVSGTLVNVDIEGASQ